jgi:NAD(P)H-hydrate epimerase
MLGSPKIGPFLKAGFATTGEIRVLDIGIPLTMQPAAAPRLLTVGEIKTYLPERPLAGHKGTFGRLLVIAGSVNYVGAAHLTVQAASRSGVGLVTLASPTSVYKIVAPTLPESTFLPLPERQDGSLQAENAATSVCNNLQGKTALVIGPGLGQNLETSRFIENIIENLGSSTRLVLDADCLNILAIKKRWWKELPYQSIVTPHPAEMARLLGSTVNNVQDDRLDIARTAAKIWGHIVVLKGPCTIVAHPDGRVSICPWINPGLAKAGSGDVLAGVIGGLLAQMPSMPMEAACLGVYVHGLAGEINRANIGEMGMTAGDLVRTLPSAYRKIANDTETNRDMLQPTI